MCCFKKQIASILCIAAGLLLTAEWFVKGADFGDVLGLAMGLYFIGKGLFIGELLSLQRKLLEK